MSHFSVMVIGENWKEQLDKFQELDLSNSFDNNHNAYGYYVNPNTKWDWYVLGGRWSGFLKLKNNSNGVLGQPGIFNNKQKAGYVDQARKGDVDFEGIKEDKGRAAAKAYDSFHSIVNGRVVPKITLNSKEEYYNNSVIKDLHKSYYYFDLESFLVPRDEYIQKQKDKAILTYAIIYEGKWYEKDEKYNDDKWNQEFNKLVDSLPDDILLTIVDCHI